MGAKPFDDYVLAKTAITAAYQHGAGQHAKGYYSQAKEFYRQAEALLSKNKNKEAKKFFIKARLFAENAENFSRLKKFNTGSNP